MHTTDPATEGKVNPILFFIAWGWVVVPFSFGLYRLAVKIPALFSG